MKGIDVDGGAGTARVEAGVLGEELGAAASAHGRCSQPGSSPNVGTIGYTLGGGLGWLGRRLRIRLQPRARDRARDRRRRAAPGRRRQRARPLLGAAGRRRGLCGRHRDRGRPAAGLGGLRRGADLPGRVRSRSGSRLPRLGRERARRGHLEGPLPSTTADARRSRAASRQAALDHHRSVHRLARRR